MAKDVWELMTIHKPRGLPRNLLLSTELVTDIVYNQWGCFDMNRVGNCNPLILFFSNNTTQLRSALPHRVHVLNGLRDMAMNTVTYMTKNAIGTTTLNHLVEGSNPSRPIDSTAIQDFTLDRFLDRQENHLEVNQKAYKADRNSIVKSAGAQAHSCDHELGLAYMTSKVPDKTRSLASA